MIEVSWFDLERKAVLWVFQANATVDCLEAVTDQTNGMTAGRPRFDVVADVSQLTILPAMAIGALSKLHRRAPSNYGVTIIVGANVFVRSALSVAGRLAPIRGRYILVDTMEQAHHELMARQQAREQAEC